MTPKHIAAGLGLLIIGTFIGTAQAYVLFKLPQTPPAIVAPIPTRDIVIPTASPSATPTASPTATLAPVRHYVYPRYTTPTPTL